MLSMIFAKTTSPKKEVAAAHSPNETTATVNPACFCLYRTCHSTVMVFVNLISFEEEPTRSSYFPGATTSPFSFGL